jgi:oligoendopeptidase F
MGSAADLAAHFNIDVRTPDCWHLRLNLIRQDIQRFEALVDSTAQRQRLQSKS